MKRVWGLGGVAVCAIALAGCGVKDGVGNVGEKIRSAGSSVGRGMKSILPGDGEEVAPGGLGDTTWLVVEERGMRRSSGHQVRRQSTFRGQPCVVIERSRKQEVLRDGSRYETRIDTKVITSTSGAALYASDVRDDGSNRTQETVTISGGEAIFETVGPGGTKQEKIVIEPGTMFGIEPFWIIQQNPKPGDVYERNVLDRKQRQVVRETVTLRGLENETVLGMPMDVWVAESEREGFAPQQIIFTTDGRLVRIEDGDMVVRVVTEKEAKASAKVVDIVTTVPIDFALPAWDNFNELVYLADPAGEWRPYLKASEYVRLDDRGSSIVVALRRSAPHVRDATLPMKVPEEMQPYLSSNDQIMPDKRRIRLLAQKIARNQSSVLQTVALLAGWVHQKIRFSAKHSLNPSPLETLDTERGDCSEHADLFASLARALGIPTRHCHGLLIQKDVAVYHTWVEAWINGTWVPVDTTVNRVGLPAGYLLTARATGDGVPRDEFAWRMRKGQIGMILERAVKVHKTAVGGAKQFSLIPNRKKTYIGVDGSWMANLYWGFALQRPQGWKGKVQLDSVTLWSPDRQVRVVIEATEQLYRPTESGLDFVLAGLERTMPGFKKQSADILPFGSHRPVTSLFMDFTTTEGGKTLRCQQWLSPKRGRSYRIAVWAAPEAFEARGVEIRRLLETVEL